MQKLVAVSHTVSMRV